MMPRPPALETAAAISAVPTPCIPPYELFWVGWLGGWFRLLSFSLVGCWLVEYTAVVSCCLNRVLVGWLVCWLIGWLF